MHASAYPICSVIRPPSTAPAPKLEASSARQSHPSVLRFKENVCRAGAASRPALFHPVWRGPSNLPALWGSLLERDVNPARDISQAESTSPGQLNHDLWN